MARILTPKKQKWAQNRDVTLRGKALRISIQAENNYAKELDLLMNQMIREVNRSVKELYRSSAAKEYFAMDESLSSKARILFNALESKFTKLFKKRSKKTAENMLKKINKNSESSLKDSLDVLSGGLSIKTDFITADMKEVISASIQENVGLIKTIPSVYLDRVQGSVMRSITDPSNQGITGVTRDINKVLSEEAKKVKNKAKNIALDQTRKAYNNLNLQRMKKLGIEKFEWVHSGGGANPRKLHKYKLNGNIYSIENLPVIDERSGERGIPGQAVNCRCTMLPVIEFDKGE